ncbi:MAG TPA: [protein-PII] uridylyltransferase [Acidimicrobiales bacterium]|nr:[protein-PII] uridylyltransferase [Acidimicrobiales bacterium]
MATPPGRARPPGTTRANEIREARARLTDAVLKGDLAAADFPTQYARVCDQWLSSLFEEATEGTSRGCALVAVGGYGRGELTPGSDLDLVLLHKGRRHHEEIANTIWYAVWDSGIRLDHSVRTKKEAVSIARENLKVVLGLLDGRVIAGDEELATPVFVGSRDLWRREWQRYLPELEDSVLTRHRASGELAFLLEPDLKLSEGGLRDIGVLRAFGEALPEISELATSVQVRQAERVIVAARVAVQCRTSAAGDRLLLQEQDQVAETLGYEDADRLMAAIAEAGRAITTAGNEGWRRVHLFEQSENQIDSPDTELGSGVIWRRGEIALRSDADLEHHPELTMKVALAAAERNALIERATLDRLEHDTPAPTVPWSDELRSAFISLLQTGDALVPVIESLDQRRLFERFVPEWTTVRNRPQRNAYHRFTVDRHLLEAIARSAEHLGSVGRPDLLVMAAMLHDIGKGTPGDHSKVGMQLASAIATRMGFDDQDVATLVHLVQYHLILPECATRRDIDDPATSALVAKLVGDHNTLELLAALTEADGQATGTSAWGPWKSELVTNLVQHVRAIFDGIEPPEPQRFVPTAEQIELLERHEIALLAHGRHVTVVAPDRTGLLAAVTGALALHGCNVRRASAVEGIPGMALENFDVEPTFDRPVNWSRVEQEVIEGLSNATPFGELLRARDNTYAPRRPSSAYPTKSHAKIVNDVSDRASVIEVRANDRLGLLHSITTTLAEKGIDVVSALVDTLGHEVIDTFYVRDREGHKLSDPAIMNEVTSALEEVISSGSER